MKNVAIINSCNNLSTGKIALGLYNRLKLEGYNPVFYYGHGQDMEDPNIVRMESMLEIKAHIFMARLTGFQGSFSNLATTKLINDIRKREIDTIFILSIHGFYINESRILNYIGTHNLRLVYVMIDEYAYLGNCCGVEDCQLYKQGCRACPKKKKYPSSWFFNQSESIFKRKLNCYKKLDNAVFVGPEYSIVSAKDSPLSKYMKYKTLDEAVNVSFYHPKDNKEIRSKFNIPDDKIIIGTICSTINPTKGALLFTQMAKKFEQDEHYVFVHVGYKLPDKDSLPSNYLPIGFVEKDEDLVDYQSVFDLFVFPSLMDTMPNVCLEALACGTPLLCFDIAGMPYIMDSTVGTLIPPKDVDGMARVVALTKQKTFEQINTCREYALRRYDQEQYSSKLIQIALNQE